MSSPLDIAPGRPVAPDLGERWRCAWGDGRERCHYPGSLSFETRGPSKWFCRGHLFCTDGATGQQIIEASRGYARGDERRYSLPVEPVAPSSRVVVREPELALDQSEPGANG